MDISSDFFEHILLLGCKVGISCTAGFFSTNSSNGYVTLLIVLSTRTWAQYSASLSL
jgi:hypothetical protein